MQLKTIVPWLLQITLLVLGDDHEWSKSLLDIAGKGAWYMNVMLAPACPSHQHSGDVDGLRARGWKLTDKTSLNAAVTDTQMFLEIEAFHSTGNFYIFHANFTQGLVIVRKIFRDKKNILPWSMVFFILYKHFAPQYNAEVAGISTIIHEGVTNIDTQEIIDEIDEAWDKKLSDTREVQWLDWPSVEWNAIVGSPNGKGQACFLFQHRADLEGMIISHIAIRRNPFKTTLFFYFDLWGSEADEEGSEAGSPHIGAAVR